LLVAPRMNQQKSKHCVINNCLPFSKCYIILDWDDTLMPSTYITSKRFSSTSTKESRAELRKAGQAALALLTSLYSKYPASNIIICTNAMFGWVPASLDIAAAACPIYKKISALLLIFRTEIYYARDVRMAKHHWKTVVFDTLIRRFRARAGEAGNINVITMGDQWTDHWSVEKSPAFCAAVNHHHIKLFAEPDPRYLSVELNYVTNSLVHKDVLLMANGPLLLEFEGYNETEAEPTLTRMTGAPTGSANTISANSKSVAGNFSNGLATQPTKSTNPQPSIADYAAPYVEPKTGALTKDYPYEGLSTECEDLEITTVDNGMARQRGKFLQGALL